MDITRRLVAVYAGAVDREPALAPELLFLATEMLATSASQLAQWSRDVATFPADPENDRLSSELRGRLEELVATCVLWIGDTGLDDTGLDDTAQRQLAGRLVWALGPALAARTGMLESPESCAAIERARSATRDGEVREHLDALARGGRCR